MVIADRNDGKWKIVDSDEMKQLVASWIKAPKYQIDGEDVPLQPKSNETTEQVSHKSTIPVNLCISREILCLLRKSRHKSHCLHEIRFVYLVDTGGQPQFQEVLFGMHQLMCLFSSFLRSSVVVQHLLTTLVGIHTVNQKSCILPTRRLLNMLHVLCSLVVKHKRSNMSEKNQPKQLLS